jgi:mannosyltransferase
MAFVNLRDCAVIAPNLHRRYSGITSVVITIVPELAKHIAIASLGPYLPARVPRIGWWQLFTQGWSKPNIIPPPVGGRSGGGCHLSSARNHSPHPNPPPTGEGINKRIWHARRNDEMLIGIILRDILRQPWLLTFTSTAQRHHTAFTKFLMRRMNGLLAGTGKAANYLEIPAMVIDNSIETARFAPAPNREQAWAETGLSGKYGIGVFGRVRHQKGTDLFVEAMCRLLPRYPDFTAIIVGLCAPEQKAFTDRLKSRIKDAGLEQRIVFIGEMKSEDVPVWFSRLTVYVAPMRWEGFGLTPIEAMASEVAVVATAAGAHEQIVVEGETGFLVPPGNLEALISAIEPLLADPSKAYAMGKKGREKALKQHDVAVEAQKTLQAYDLLWSGQALPDERFINPSPTPPLSGEGLLGAHPSFPSPRKGEGQGGG